MNKRNVTWLDPNVLPEEYLGPEIPPELSDHLIFLKNSATQRTDKDPKLKESIISKFGSIEKWANCCLSKVKEHLDKDFDAEEFSM